MSDAKDKPFDIYDTSGLEVTHVADSTEVVHFPLIQKLQVAAVIALCTMCCAYCVSYLYNEQDGGSITNATCPTAASPKIPDQVVADLTDAIRELTLELRAWRTSREAPIDQ